MKSLYKILIFSFLLFNNAYPQFYAEDEISPYIIEFMEKANEFSKSFDQVQGIHKIKFTDDEVEHIAELFFKVYDEDPVGFHNYIREAYYKWEGKVKGSGGKITEPIPALKRKHLVKKIANKYGIAFTEIIGTPAFLRGKFISSTRSSYYWSERKSSIGQMNFNFLIEDILKGEKFFNIGDTVIILMIPNVESPSPSFEEGKSYLIPVKPRFGSAKYNGEVGFNYLSENYNIWVMGVPPKVFPIENEIIANCEYLGIEDTNWIEFKKYFRETFLIFN